MLTLFSAHTPARSNSFLVKSRCNNERDSGRNSASAMAPGEVRPVEERKSRLREELSVNAVRSEVICHEIKKCVHEQV